MTPSRTSPRDPRRRRWAGFTLIELLVIMVVVGVVMAIAVPKLRLSRPMAVQLAGMQLAQDVDVTRTRALSTRLRARIRFHEGQRRYGGYLDVDGDGAIGETAAEWQALRGFGLRELPAGVSFGRGSAAPLPDVAGGGGITFADARVEFDSRGIMSPSTSGSGAVYLVSNDDPSAVVAVAVAPSGNTRLWTWHAGGWQ